MTIPVLVLLFTSHALASVPFWRSIRAGRMPATVEFATMSVILYYDIGMFSKWLFPEIKTEYFPALMAADDRTLTLAVLILASAPWLFRAGAALIDRGHDQGPAPELTSLGLPSLIVFYVLCVAICVPLAYTGITLARSHEEVWAIRARMTASWGPLIVIFYLPLHLLAFYVSQQNSRNWFGMLVAIGLALATIALTAPIGQRTTILLPILVIVFFRLKLSIPRIVLTAVGSTVAAALMLTTYKWQYSTSSGGVSELIVQTIADDFSRDGVLARVLEAGELVGTRVLPYPMSGYAYCALFFIPRWLAPVKGYPTAQYFTGYVVGLSVEGTDWGFGVGALEEILLNGGLLLFIPIMLVYGVMMGLFDRLTRRVPSLLVPTRLGAVWICGYNLSALILVFGTMFVVGLALHATLVALSSAIAPAPKLRVRPARAG